MASALASGFCGDHGGLSGTSGLQGRKSAWRRPSSVAAPPKASPCSGEGSRRLPSSSSWPRACGSAGRLLCANNLQGRRPALRRNHCATARPRAPPFGGRAGRGSRRHLWCLVLLAALTASPAPAALKSGNLLRGVLLARRRLPGALPDRRRTVCNSRRPHRHQVFVALLVASPVSA